MKKSGTAYQAPVAGGTLADARDAGRRVASSGGTAQDQEALVRGAVAYASLPPGEAVVISKVPRASVRTVRVVENRGPAAPQADRGGSRADRGGSRADGGGPELG